MILTNTSRNDNVPDSKVHGANMRPIWGRQDPGGSHDGPMNLAIWGRTSWMCTFVSWYARYIPPREYCISMDSFRWTLLTLHGHLRFWTQIEWAFQNNCLSWTYKFVSRALTATTSNRPIPYPEPVYTGWSSVHWNATGMPLVDPVYTGKPLGDPANTCRVHWNTTRKT